MNTSRIEHVWPDGHWQEAEFVSFKVGTFDDTSVGYLACTDNEGPLEALLMIPTVFWPRCY